MYDSREDTEKHIKQVATFLTEIVDNLVHRGVIHDASKLFFPEKVMYDEYTPKLKSLTYGSDEYMKVMQKMGDALQHHFRENSHHPEHYENGINGMSLLDLIEMLADWKAASMRHSDGDLIKSMEVNKKRFGMSDQLVEIFMNTIKELGY